MTNVYDFEGLGTWGDPETTPSLYACTGCGTVVHEGYLDVHKRRCTREGMRGMTTSRTRMRRTLEEIGVHNEWEIAQLAVRGGFRHGVYVTYRPYESMAMDGMDWQVINVGERTDPDGPWYNHGHKTFRLNGREDKVPVRRQAIEWASDRYGLDPDEWAASPFTLNAWLPRPVIEAAAKQARVEAAAR